MLYIFSGADDYSIDRSIDEIKKDIDDQAMFPAMTTTLDGQQLTSEQLQTACGGATLLGEKRLVVIRRLLARFQANNRQRRSRKTARATETQDDHQAWSNGIHQIPESTVLVLVEERINNNNRLYKEVAGKAVVRSFPLLRDAKLRQWAEKRVKDEGGSISRQAVDLLVRLIGNNLWIMAGEINKLVIYAAGRRIEEEDVNNVVSYVQLANVFTMVDAIVEYNAQRAQQLLGELLQAGATPSYLLAMLSRQIRMIVRSKEMARQKKPRAEIQQRLGLTSEYALRKTLEQAGKYSLTRLKDIYHKLLEADLSIKTGKYGEELTLNILVAELGERDKPAESVVSRYRAK